MTHHLGKRRIMFAVVFVLLGLVLCYTGLQSKFIFVCLFLLWAGSNFLVVSLAYFFNWRRVFGKTDQGTLHWPAVLFMAPFLTLTSLTWRLQNLVSPSPIYGEVAPHLYVGRRCQWKELPDGVTLVIDLTAEFATPRSIRESVQTICIPTLDGCCPDWSQCEQAFTALKSNEGGVYICCANGCGRSVTFTAAWMFRKGRCLNGDEAIQLIRMVRPNASPNRDQLDSLRKLAINRC